MNKNVVRIINYCTQYAITDLTKNTTIPFGVVINTEEELLLVENQKELPNVDKISPKSIVDALTKHFRLQLFLESVTYYGITYYGEAQINNWGGRSKAFMITIESNSEEDFPIYIFPYSWSKNNKLIQGEAYQMRKKAGKFYA